MAERDLDELYHQIYDNYLRRLKAVYNERMNYSTDKEYAFKKFKELYEISKLIYDSSTYNGNQDTKEVYEVFDHYRKMGKSIKFSIDRVYLYLNGSLRYIPNSALNKDESYDPQYRFCDYLNKTPYNLVWELAMLSVQFDILKYLQEEEPKIIKKEIAGLDNTATENLQKNDKILESIANTPTDKHNTISRQILTIYYLLKSLNRQPDPAEGNALDYTKLIFIILGKDPEKAKNTDHYKHLRNPDYPFNRSKQHLKKDLEYILPFFKNMNFDKISDEIEVTIEGLFK